MNKTAHILSRERITTALADAVEAFPLVVVTAPMGYGKTTAVRELASSLGQEVFYIASTTGPHNALYLWDMALRQLTEQGSAIAEALQHMGFPSDITHVQRVMTICKTHFATHPSVLMIDDYHFVADHHMDMFIETLVREAIPGLHIVLLSRTRPGISLEDLQVKGLARVFAQDLLTFSEQETHDFFTLHGAIDSSAASDAWIFSEGWAAAIWLSLQSWRTGGVIRPVQNIETLLSEAVFSTYAAEDQSLLLQLAILDGFSARQASAVLDDALAPRRLRAIHNQNAFLSYNATTDKYQLHSIFRDYLLKQLAETPCAPCGSVHLPALCSIDKPALYRRAGEWFAAQGDTLQAARFFEQAGRDEDLLRLLELFTQPSNGLFVMFAPEGFATMVQGIPWKLRSACPLGYLAFIYHYMSRVNLAQGAVLLEEAARYFAKEPGFSESLQKRIAGEIALIRGIDAFNDLFAMRDRYKEAYALLQGASAISHHQLVWTFGSPHAAFLYLREGGSYNQLVTLVEENLHQYQEMTGGCSAGAQDLFRAEYLLETGHTRDAEAQLMKAAYKAMTKDQLASLIAINFSLSRLLLSRGKVLEARDVILHMDARIWQTNNPLLRNSLDMCQGYLAAMAGYREEIPLWLRQGNMDSTHSFYQGQGFALIARGKALQEAGDWLNLEALAEELPARLGAYRNLFGYIHAFVMRGVAAINLHKQKQAVQLLQQAIELARPDGIVCTIAEYGNEITPLLRQLHNEKPKDVFIKKLYHAAKPYITKNVDKKPLLATQEQAVLEKVVQGLSNKEIAENMGLALSSVNNTLSRVYAKLSVKNRTQAISKWLLQKK